MVGAATTFDAGDLDTTGENIREDLSDIIYNISPTEVPFQSNIDRASATSDLHEWLQDDLQAAGPNAHLDGSDFGSNADQAGTTEDELGSLNNDQTEGANRLGNFLQISKKQLKVSRRANIVNKAGRRSEIGYQIAKKGKEIKRDIERALTGNNPAQAEGAVANAPALSAGLRAWLRTNDILATAGAPASPALSSTTFGQPTTAATDGTAQALEEAEILQVIRQIYNAGGDPKMIMMHPDVKQRWSSFLMSDPAGRSATQYQDQGRSPRGGVTVVGAVDTYVSDFGVLDIVPNRFQRTRDVYVVDPDLFAVAYLDGYKVERLAKVGDSERYHIIVDWCLESNDEAGSGVVADVDSATAVIAGT